MLKLAFISGNEGKYNEIRATAARHGIEVTMHPLSPPEIQATDLETVAEFSLQYLIDNGKIAIDDSGMLLIESNRYHAACVEDSGLFINALGGFPGVYSSYVFKTIGNEGILKLMEGLEDRKAYFKSVMAFVYIAEGGTEIAHAVGIVKGRIANECLGTGGFGYDPIFIPEGHDKTFAQDIGLKNTLSHRAKATREMMEKLREVFLV